MYFHLKILTGIRDITFDFTWALSVFIFIDFVNILIYSFKFKISVGHFSC